MNTVKPYYDNGLVQLYQADARELPLEDGSVHCCVTSPPYFGLRVYQTDDARVLGLEASIEEYIVNLVDVFREVKRVLRDDGVCWINMGDSYAGSGKGLMGDGSHAARSGDKQRTNIGTLNLTGGLRVNEDELPGGNVLGVPWRLALALQQDGWILRDSIVWAKASPMPESLQGWRWEQCRVKVSSNSNRDHGKNALSENRTQVGFNDRWDALEGASAQYSPCPGCAKCEANDGLVLRKGSWRCTSSYELIFMLVKSMGYWADGEAVKTQVQESSLQRIAQNGGNPVWNGDRERQSTQSAQTLDINQMVPANGKANRRNVWRDIHAEPYSDMTCPECERSFKSRVYRRFPKFEGHPICPRCEEPLQSHYATFPTDLPRICIQASTSEGGCCPKCGSQITRVVGRESGPPESFKGSNFTEGKTGVNGLGRVSQPERMGDVKPLGWRATCGHPEALGQPEPCLVLDPFMGTGTTALPAMRLQRRCVGTDLSEEYIKQAQARLSEQTLPMPLTQES